MMTRLLHHRLVAKLVCAAWLAAAPGLPPAQAGEQSKAQAKAPAQPKTWSADNGNGTFTNPLFYDEFSDPDLIRVGDWFYMTGTCLLYTSPSPRDATLSRMPSSA